MLKILLKIILVSILFLGIGNYAYYLNTGESIDIKKPELPEINIPEIKDILPDKITPISKESILYKWRDENGVIYYSSDKPSDEERNIEIIKINNDTNVMPSIATSKPKENVNLNNETTINPVNKIEQLVEQAEDIQLQAKERLDAIEATINN